MTTLSSSWRLRHYLRLRVRVLPRFASFSNRGRHTYPKPATIPIVVFQRGRVLDTVWGRPVIGARERPATWNRILVVRCNPYPNNNSKILSARDISTAGTPYPWQTPRRRDCGGDCRYSSSSEPWPDRYCAGAHRTRPDGHGPPARTDRCAVGLLIAGPSYIYGGDRPAASPVSHSFPRPTTTTTTT